MMLVDNACVVAACSGKVQSKRKNQPPLPCQGNANTDFPSEFPIAWTAKHLL